MQFQSVTFSSSFFLLCTYDARIWEILLRVSGSGQLVASTAVNMRMRMRTALHELCETALIVLRMRTIVAASQLQTNEA